MNLNRRHFLKTAGLGAAAVLAGCAASTSTRKPNIIFIMADDLGWGDVGCYGQTKIKTPHIDNLAHEGLRFTNCYAGGAVCAPSRSVLMTGQHLGHTRVRGNGGKVGGVEVTDNGGLQRRVPLEAEDITVAELLKKAGYTTGMTGKWGLGEPGTFGEPNQQGFDDWFGYLNQRRAHTYWPPYLWKNGEKIVLDENKNGRQGAYSHDMFTEFALEFLERNKNNPFFLFVPYTIPHYKLHPPSLAPYENKEWTEDQKAYAAMVTRMDKDVGRIMTWLQESKRDKDTIVFFCSDNGGLPREKIFFNSTGPYRGAKGVVYEGGLRVPMIVRYPGKVHPNTTSETPWYFADVLPTLMDLIGEQPPDNIDGISVLPTILGKKQDLSDRFMYWEHHTKSFSQAVRWGDWKAVRPEKETALELYDLKSDKSEEHDIASSRPDIVTKIEEYLQTARTESANWPI
jgi:arylsulfatase A-like enzyme